MDLKTLSTRLVLCALFAVSAVSCQGDTSCVGRCGEGYSRTHACHCDYNCMSFMECCQDYKTVCTTEASCKGRCHEGFIRGQNCDCDPSCESYGRCCSDYKATCAVQHQSPPAPSESQPVTDERDRTPRATRKPTEERGRGDEPTEDPEQRDEAAPKKRQRKTPKPTPNDLEQEPQGTEEDPETSPSSSRPRAPSKNKKNVPEKPKKNLKKKKEIIQESEEEITESEENVSSSSFSSSSSSTSLKGSKTTKKLSRKNQNKNKPGDDDDPDKGSKKKRKPSTDDEVGKPKKPKTLKGEDDPENPQTPPEDPDQKRPNGKNGKSKKPKGPKDKDGEEPDDPDRNPKEPNQLQPDGKEGQPKKPKKPKEKGSGDDPEGTPKGPKPKQPDSKGDKPKKPKTPKDKEGEGPEKPNRTPKDPNQSQTPESEDGEPKKPKTPKEKEPDDGSNDPNGKPKEPNQTRSAASSPASPPADKGSRVRKLKIEEEEENVEENSVQEDSVDNSSSASKNTKKRSPANGNKQPRTPISADELVNPRKGKKPQNKPSPKDLAKKKKKVKSKAERQETVESEFSSASQSSSSHRRSKSSSRRLSGKKQKNINEKNKKKIPDEKPLSPPKRKKGKGFPPTPVPTSEESSGDEGSGMDFFQTTPSTATGSTQFTTKPSESTAKTSIPEDMPGTSTPPKTEESAVTSDKTATSASPSTAPSQEQTSKNPNAMSALTTTQEDKPKESATGTDKSLQPTSTSATLQEQSTTAAPKSDGPSQTPNSEGSQETTTARSNDIKSTGPSSGFNNDKYNATTPQMHVGSTKPSDRSDTTPGQGVSTTSVGTVRETSNPSVQSSENKSSTQMSFGSTSPTTQIKIGTTTMSPSAAPSSPAAFDTQKVVTTQKSDTTTLKEDNMGKVSTAESPIPTTKPPSNQQKTTKSPGVLQTSTTVQPKEDLPRSTPKPKSDMERQVTPTQQRDGITSATTKPVYDVTTKDGTLESAVTTSASTNVLQSRDSTTKSPVSSFSTPPATPTKKYVITQKPMVYVTARPLGIEEIVIKNETSFPLPLDPFHICDLLKDPDTKVKISVIDLERLTQVCADMKQSVSTPPWETQPPNPNPNHQAMVPPRHTITTILEPRWNQPPGWRIIQILEEIKRRANVPQTPVIHGVPGLHTNKSSAWLLLLNKFRSPPDPQMNLCVGPPADGMTTLQNGSMVVFRGHYFWTLNQGGATERPRRISEVWGIPSPIDTVFTRCNCGGKTFFFKGPHYWRFSNDIMDPGYPKEIINGFGGLRGKITAVLSVAGVKTRPESVYFFKNGGNVQKYTFRQEQSKKCAKRKQPDVQYPIYSRNIQTVKYRFPRNIVRRIQIHRTFTNVKQVPIGVLHEEVSVRSTWRGIPNNIVSALSLPNPQKQDGFDYYVFSKEKYYNINMSSKVAVKPPAQAEQTTTKDWYKCNE